MTHLRCGQLPGFSLAWNLLFDIPLFTTSFLYEGIHTSHHARALYGTRGTTCCRPYPIIGSARHIASWPSAWRTMRRSPLGIIPVFARCSTTSPEPGPLSPTGPHPPPIATKDQRERPWSRQPAPSATCTSIHAARIALAARTCWLSLLSTW